MTTKRLFTTICTLALTLSMAWAQGPNGSNTYYQAANGKKGEALKTAMFNIIKISNAGWSYDGLKTAYITTDTRPDGYLRDWYSNATSYTPGSNCASSYKVEGDGYNREHLVPQSWFSKNAPMVSDIFHVVPSDAKINGMRGDKPLAEVGTIEDTSKNGYSKWGTVKSGLIFKDGKPVNSLPVFEPNDEVKGDIARAYFYMVTCYENKISDWNSAANASYVFDGNTYPGLTNWCLTMMMRWSALDPVDDIEIARNNVIAAKQNRNPFIDYPGLEEYIWGEWQGVEFSYDNYVSPYGGETPITVSTPTFSPVGGNYTTAQTVTISCSTSGAIIYYTTNGSTPSASSTMYNGAITISETTTLKAIAIKDGTSSNVATATYTIGGDEPMPIGNGSFTKVTSTSQLVAGYEYIFVAETSKQVMNSTAKTTYFEGSVVDISNNTITYDESMLVLTLGGSNGAWTFRNGSNFLVSTGAKKVSLSSSSATWTISTATFTATPKTSSYGTLQYNAASPRFTTYTSTQEAAVLYYRIPKTTTPGDIVKDGTIDWNDLKALVKILLGITPAGNNIDTDAADVNGDGEPNIADVTRLVNKLLQNNQ